MDGVTIIKTIEVAEAPPTIIIVLFSILTMLFILGGVVMMCAGISETEPVPVVLGLIVLILGFVLGAWLGSLPSTTTEAETRYQVIIDDTVSIGELTEHYEILEVDEKIFTVREK